MSLGSRGALQFLMRVSSKKIYHKVGGYVMSGKSGMRTSLLVLMLFCGLATTHLFSEMSFLSRRDLERPEFDGPVAVALADFNRDGIVDLAVANALTNPSQILIFIGNNRGGFSYFGAYPVNYHPFSIVARDFRNNGILDLAVATYSTNTLAVLLGNGDGTFMNAQYFEVSAAPTTVTAGDFNNDGILDLAAACLGPFDPERANNKISVLLGDGQGNFYPPPCGRDFDVGRAPEGIDVGDFNRDGRLDIAAANIFSDTVTVLINQPDMCFSRADYAVRQRPSTVVVGDFNNDNKLDLSVLNELSAQVSILLGNGNGTFQPAQSFPSAPPYSYGVRMVANDFNMDNKLDVAIAGASEDRVRVFLGDGTGRLVEPVRSFQTGALITAAVATADLNGDSVLDLVTANKGRIFEPPPPPGNVSILTGDGFGNFGNFIKTMGIEPSAVTTGDFDGDNNLDVAVVNTASNTVAILLGDGEGGFEFTGLYEVDREPVAVIAADFNRDGNLDLAIANKRSNNVTVLLGDGMGGFPDRRDFGAGVSPNSLVAGDFNGDFNLDLAIANQGSNTVTVIYGDGTGDFLDWTYAPVGAAPHFVTTADVNNDRNLDLIVANSDSDSVTVLLGDGRGAFPTRMDTTLEQGSRPYAIAVGLFNVDTNLDLAVANNGSNTVAVLFGDGTGRFPTNRIISVDGAVGPSSIISADLNRDGALDLAVANAASNNVSVLQGDGAGNFFVAITPNPFVGLNPVGIAQGDLNGDQRPELIFVNSGSNTLSILFNASRP